MWGGAVSGEAEAWAGLGKEGWLGALGQPSPCRDPAEKTPSSSWGSRKRLQASEGPPEAWGGGEKDKNRNRAGGRRMDLGRQGGRQQGQRHQQAQAKRLPHPVARPHLLVAVRTTPGTECFSPARHPAPNPSDATIKSVHPSARCMTLTQWSYSDDKQDHI